jgi:hypothetical protein
MRAETGARCARVPTRCGAGTGVALVFDLIRFLRKTALVSCCLAYGCAAAPERPPAAPAQQCDGEPRAQLDCSTEVQYDARRMQGGFSGFGVQFDASTEVTALREIDATTAQYIAQARRLCDEYNKCVIDRETYSLRSENLRRRLSRVPELYERLQNSADAASRRQALADAYGALVPAGEQPLELSISVVADVPGRAGSTVVRDGAALPSGSRLRFAVEASRSAYLYLFQRSPRGTLTVLFPDGRMRLQNPIPGATTVSIPPDAGSYRLDNQDLGLEKVYVAASLSPIRSLSEGSASGLDAITDDPNCRTRALSYELSAPNAGCVRQRGLVLEPTPTTSTEAPSLRVRSEVADDTIIRVFAFNHTP